MKELLIRSHLGLGDHLVCCGIVRTLAETYKMVVLCKQHNLTSVSFMLRDLAQVEVFPLDSDSADQEADSIMDRLEKKGYQVLRLGFTGVQPFDALRWDREMYRQADVPFEDKWNKFHVERTPSREIGPPKTPFILIHDDPTRGFCIHPNRLPAKPKHIRVEPSKSQNIFDWCSMIKNATELHFIDSSFAVLADHMGPLKAKRLVIHDYARKGLPPCRRNEWEHLT